MSLPEAMLLVVTVTMFIILPATLIVLLTKEVFSIVRTLRGER